MDKEIRKEKNVIDNPEYEIRYSELSDEQFLKQTLLDEETCKWYPPSSESDINIFVRNWAGYARYKSSLTALYKGDIAGCATIFLMPYTKVAHLAMMYMVVAKKFQNKGIGGSLLKNINHLAKTKFNLESLHVEIFEGSPIEAILGMQGYKEIIFQKNFVEFTEGMRGRKIYEVDLKGE